MKQEMIISLLQLLEMKINPSQVVESIRLYTDLYTESQRQLQERW